MTDMVAGHLDRRLEGIARSLDDDMQAAADHLVEASYNLGTHEIVHLQRIEMPISASLQMRYMGYFVTRVSVLIDNERTGFHKDYSLYFSTDRCQMALGQETLTTVDDLRALPYAPGLLAVVTASLVQGYLGQFQPRAS